MRYMLALVLAGCALTVTGWAQQPTGPGPQFAMIQTTDPAKGTVVWVEDKLVPTTVQKFVPKQITMNGMVFTINEPVNETVMVHQKILREWSAQTSRAYDGTGNLLTKEALFQRLKAGDAVLLIHGQRLDPAFQRLLNKDAVVLSLGPVTP